MPVSQSVLALLTTRFAVHPENLGTEALGFVLLSIQHARDAFVTFISGLGFRCPSDTVFSTQESASDGSRA